MTEKTLLEKSIRSVEVESPYYDGDSTGVYVRGHVATNEELTTLIAGITANNNLSYFTVDKYYESGYTLAYTLRYENEQDAVTYANGLQFETTLQKSAANGFVQYSPLDGKWCFGGNCAFHTKGDAELAAMKYWKDFNLEEAKTTEDNTVDSGESEIEVTVKVKKALDEEQQLFTAVVLEPEVTDLHGDIYSHEVVEKAAHDFMLNSQQGNLQHMINTDDMSVVESWVTTEDMILGEQAIVKGTWLMTTKIHSEEIWALCKSGGFTVFSVGCMGTIEDINND